MLILSFIVITAVLGVAYWAYLHAFRRDDKRQALEMDVPYAAYRKAAIEKIYALMNVPFESVTITSFDGLNLYGRYYHFRDGAPVAIIMHGYRSNYCRDGNGAFSMLRDMGFNILMPDQRAHGKSGGKVITYGIKERCDCLGWVEYIKKKNGNDVQIALMGVSMGAATVMMASDIVPKENVKVIAADCGYSSPREIICHVAKKMKLPPLISYPFVILGAFLFGRVNINEASAVKSLEKTEIPVLFIHGEDDGFVPCSMSQKCFEHCSSPKEILTVPGASHGVSYYVDNVKYEQTARNFVKKFMKM